MKNIDILDSALYELALARLLKKIPTIKKGGRLEVEITRPNMLFMDILYEMKNIVDTAYKNKQKEQLDNFIKERYDNRKI